MSNKKKKERKREKIRQRMTPTCCSVVRYVVHREVGTCMEEKKWINVIQHNVNR